MSGFLRLCGNESVRIKQSIWFGFADGIFESFPFLAVFYLFRRLGSLEWKADRLTGRDVCVISLIFLTGVLGRWIMKYLVYHFQSVVSYDAVARSRLAIGDHLKKAPMGYFNSNSIGNTVTTLTDDLHYIEQNAASILEKTINAGINALVLIVGISIFDWRIGITFFIGSLLSILIISLMQSAGLKAATVSKEYKNRANSKVIEYLGGLSVYKLFPESERTATEMSKVFQDMKDSSYQMEKSFIQRNFLFFFTERCICGLIMILTGMLTLQGSMTVEKAVIMFIAVFVIYKPLESLGTVTGMVRMMEISLERVQAVEQVPVMPGGNRMPDHYGITLKNVSFHYDEADQADVIKNVSLTIPEKSFTAIVGASGCGKTTLTRLIARFWDCTAGSVKIGGINVKEIEPENLYSCFSIVFQNVFLFNDTIENNIRFGKPDATHEEVVAGAKKACCHEFIEKLPEKYHTLAGEGGGNLSGGEKQLIALASVYMADPEVFVLDEPTANLDLASIDILKRMLQQIKQEGKTILIAEHRLTYFKYIADTVVFMEQGKKKCVYTGKEFFSLDDEKRTEMGLRRLRDLSSETDVPQAKRKEPGVGLDQVKISYGKRTVLEHISFQAYRGDIIGITGNNGVGKTTLCRTICGLIQETEGKVTYGGKSVKPADRQKRSYLIMQDVNHQLFGESVEEECRIDQNPVTDAKIHEILKQLDLSAEVNRHPMSLSGGQKQRLAIAVSLLLKKDIYIFDEPTSGLDYASMCAVRDQIRMLAESGATVFLVTHDMELLDTLCNRCLFVCRDRVVEIFADTRGYSGYVKKMLKKEDGGRRG